MPTTLISAIGRGRKDDTKTAYEKVSYTIDGRLQDPTPFFVQAWLQAKGQWIDRVELIGTRTSAWSALVEEYTSDDVDLYSRLEAGADERSKGVSDEDLQCLAEILGKHWGKEVRCHVLCQQEIDDSHAPEILEKLIALFPVKEKERKRELQLDTTHGFRSLPLLALSAVQLADALHPGLAARTRLIYGEMLKGSPPRGFAFDSVLQTTQLASACRTFLEAGEAEPLAEKLDESWPTLADAIRSFGTCLELNRFDEIDVRLRQLKNALKTPGNLPCKELLTRAIAEICKELNHPTLPERLLALAKRHARYHRHGLAILALAEAATAIASPLGAEDYETLKIDGEHFKKTFLPNKYDKDWRLLFQLRNRIAHGANLANEDKRPTEQNLEKHFKTCETLIQTLIKEFPTNA